ncbi:MAG: hypothetical protein FJZ43_03595 [Candidatus Staskawiczbacteria bacterium]|nr:hypothetical protein [Candidatus Staskawiczbacteria bacterium]
MKIQLVHSYEDIISLENLLLAWKEFVKGKRKKKDVQTFKFNLMGNILSLHQDLINGTYCHGNYHEFRIADPKPRIIHKATVRDRLLHHAIYRILYPFFDRTFSADSYSCRVNKGTHRAINQFRAYAYAASKNDTQTCWILKCDIKKFFHSIDQQILIGILQEYISDRRIINLLTEVIQSFNSGELDKGLPLGNLTSQLFCNIYMNQFDQFVKHQLKAKYYIRYADDFVILSENKHELEDAVPKIKSFLFEGLQLILHPNKISIKTLLSGVDFLGWVHFFDHRVLRAVTKRRILKKVQNNSSQQSLNSYLGMLSHGNANKIKRQLLF